MDLIRIYVDEDAAHRALVDALRIRGVTVLTPRDAGLTGASDEDQLAFAAGRGFALYSNNASDFHRLHTEWMSAGREHAGIILAPQQRFTVGEQVRRIQRIRAVLGADQMRNGLEFLANWN